MENLEQNDTENETCEMTGFITIPEGIQKDLKLHELLLNLGENNIKEATLKVKSFANKHENQEQFVNDLINVVEIREKNIFVYVNLLKKLNLPTNVLMKCACNSIILRYLYEENLISIDEIKRKQPKSRLFWPELYQLNKTDFAYSMQHDYESFSANKWLLYKEILHDIYMKGTIQYSLFNDDTDLLSYFSANHLFDANAKIHTSSFVGKLRNTQLSYISFAALYGSVKCFKQLILYGAKVTEETIKCAIRGGNLEVLRVSLQYQSKYDANICLETAVEYERYDIVDFLLLNNTVQFPSMITCAKFGSIRAILHQRNDVEMEARGMLTSLHFAAINGNILAVKALIECGANINKITKDGRTALHLACIHNHSAIVSILLKHGIDSLIKTNENETAADIAKRRMNIACIKVFDESNINSADEKILAQKAVSSCF